MTRQLVHPNPRLARYTGKASPARMPEGASVASMTRRRLQHGSDRLAFTEWIFLGVMGLAYLLAASTPIFGFQLSISGLKHVPLVLMGPVLLVHFLGVVFNGRMPSVSGVLSVTWPLILLALFALGGSIVARWTLEEDETFLVFGLYLLLLPVFALVPTARGDVAHWSRAMGVLWIVAALAALAGAAAHFDSYDNLHEIEYIVTCGFFLLYYRTDSKALRALALLMMIAGIVLNHKLTGFIIGALALMYIVIDAGWLRVDRPWRPMYVLMALLVFVAVVATLTLLYFEFRAYLPSGNTNVRLRQYERAWAQFLESPIWGTAYTGGSGEVFREFNRLMNIPTHSDLLDMLKHGGVIGFGLFVAGYVKLLLVITRALKLVQDRATRAYLVSARFFLVAAAMTFAINPLLLKGPYLIVIWGNAGIALGLSLALLREER